MIEIMALMMSLISLAFAIWAIWAGGGRYFVFTAPSIYLLVYFFYHYPLYFLVDEPRWEYLLVLNLGLVGFTMGLLVAMHKIRPRAARIQWQWHSISDWAVNRVYVGLLTFGIIIMLLYFQGIPPTAKIFMDLLSAGDVYDQLVDMSSFRRELTKSHYFGGEYRGQGVLRLANELVWQLLMVLSFSMAMIRRRRGSWILFGVTFLLGAISIYGTGAKAPLAWTIVAMFIATSYIFRLKIRKLIFYTAILVLMVFLLMASQPGRYDESAPLTTSVPRAVFHRVFMGNGYNTYEIVTRRIDGEIAPFYGYEHLTVFMNTFPGVQFDLPFANTLFFILNPEASRDRTTYASFTYIGAMYLDFGMLGVLLISLITGMVLQFGQRIIWRWRPSLLTVSFGAILSLKLGKTVTSNLISLGPSLIVLTVLYAIAWSAMLPVKRLATQQRKGAL